MLYMQTTTTYQDYGQAASSELHEWSKASSKSSMTGAAAGVGAVLGPVVIGGGVVHGRSSSS